MKTKLGLVILFICFITFTYSQSIIAGRTSTATNDKLITTGTNPLHKNLSANKLQVQSALQTNGDSVINYQLTFYSTQLPDGVDESQLKNCVIEDDENNKYTGILNIDNAASNNIKKINYVFSKEDFLKIIASKKITEIKLLSTDGKSNSITIDKDLQDKIINQAKTLSATIKINSGEAEQ